MAESTKSGTGSPKAGNRVARIVEILTAACLFGGTLAVGAIAQVAFGSPEILSREQAGRLLAEVFERSVGVELALVAAVAVAAAISRAWKRALVAFPLLALLVVAHDRLAVEMREVRRLHGGTVANLDASHEDRVRFGRLHGFYSAASLSLLLLSGGLLAAHGLRRGEEA